MNPDLYQGLMPGVYADDPLRAFFNVLDDEQCLDAMRAKKVLPDHEDGAYCLWEGYYRKSKNIGGNDSCKSNQIPRCESWERMAIHWALHVSPWIA